jgi:hypothetical protein
MNSPGMDRLSRTSRKTGSKAGSVYGDALFSKYDFKFINLFI